MNTKILSTFHWDGILLDTQSIAVCNAFNETPDEAKAQLAILNNGEWMFFEIPTDRLVSLASTAKILFAVGCNGLFLRIELPLALERPGVIRQISMEAIPKVHSTGEIVRCRLECVGLHAPVDK